MKYENFKEAQKIANQIDSLYEKMEELKEEPAVIIHRRNNTGAIFAIETFQHSDDEHAERARMLIKAIQGDISVTIEKLKSKLEKL